MCVPRSQDPWAPIAPPPEPDAGATVGFTDAAIPTRAALVAPPPACPPEMVLVDGMYCPEVKHECKRYIDEIGAKGYLRRHRCAEFATNPQCKKPREHRRFCIDRYEYSAKEDKPLVNQSWTMARDTCRDLGKRLCFGSEWAFACEGEAMLPYPYGFERDAKRCNHDRSNLSRRGKLVDYRVKSTDRPKCTSPFGVMNLVGNVDEWVYRDGFIRPWRSSLRGGWWLAGRNNCRAATTGHDEFYFGPQTGFRCCKDPAS